MRHPNAFITEIIIVHEFFFTAMDLNIYMELP